jgi:diguanylate cyclase (GGDEF)-like protein
MSRVPVDRRARGTGQGLASRIGAFLFLGGAVITALATFMPHPGELDTTAFLVNAGLQAVAGVIILALPRDVGRARWLPGAVVVIGILAVTAAVYYNGERQGGPPFFNEFFYVWPAFYIGYFFGPRAIAASLILLAGLYAGVLDSFSLPRSESVTRWIVTVSVVSFTAIALHMLRRRIDRLVEQLRETARTDPLTMLLNRRGFDERFVLELERARRADTPMALLVADLDRFKTLNDRFGHAAGDKALAAVGQTLVEGCRSIDTVARIGGEEFAILLPSTDASGGLELAERLRADVAHVNDAGGHPLTVSVGVVEFPRDGTTPEELMGAADQAMYRAKALGRDRTVVCGSPEAMAPLA